MTVSFLNSGNAFRQTRLTASTLLIAAGLLLAVAPASALGQSGVDQYRENVPNPGGAQGAPSPPETDVSEPSDDSAAGFDEAAEEVVADPSSDPAPAAESPEPETLPRTGPDAVPMALLGAALVLLGVSLLAATGRTRRWHRIR